MGVPTGSTFAALCAGIPPSPADQHTTLKAWSSATAKMRLGRKGGGDDCLIVLMDGGTQV